MSDPPNEGPQKYTVRAAGGARDQLVGQVLANRFRIDRPVGAGGMGTVYEGVQLGLDRRVAIKVIRHELSQTDSAVARFRREAKVAAGLQHPNIVIVHDFDVLSDGLAYLVMEYLGGPNLAQWIREQKQPDPSAAFSFFRPVCSAMAALHRAGVIHRDLKPSNIVLPHDGSPDATVKIVDFGLVHLQEASPEELTGSFVLGTPDYMAPELYAGETASVSTDIYALGVTLYEALTLKLPFEGDTAQEIFYQKTHKRFRAASELVPGLPKGIDAALAKALSTAPEARFLSIEEFVAMLDQALPARSKARHVPTPSDFAIISDESPTRLASVLVVDDSNVVREFLSRYLDKQGFEVVAVGDGVEALMRVGSRHFDLIISDLKMPLLDGRMLLKLLGEKGVKVPVILLSSSSDAPVRDELMRMGAREFLTKPPKVEELLMAVRRALEE